MFLYVPTTLSKKCDKFMLNCDALGNDLYRKKNAIDSYKVHIEQDK